MVTKNSMARPSTASVKKEPATCRRNLIAAIDVGTDYVRLAIFRAREAEELHAHQVNIERVIPGEGWEEQDPKMILEAVEHCVDVVVQNMDSSGLGPGNIACIGICNAPETAIAWDCRTGEHLYNAILSSDIRTNSMAHYITEQFPNKNKNHLRSVSGLPVCSTYTALKIRWLIDNLPGVYAALCEKRLLVGTLDSWLIWKLTGGPDNGKYVTDVTNASRTSLMNIRTLMWDCTLCRCFNIPIEILPEIKSSSEIYGSCKMGCLDGIPISGLIANQQSSLIGLHCLFPGQTKNTYKKSATILCNTGSTPISTEILETTVAYKLGPDTPPVYALQGTIAVAGKAIQWLKDNMKLMPEVEESETLAGNVQNTGGVYFVPAFKGLGPPHCRKHARGIICGINGHTTKDHIIRAAIESTCFQTKDLMRAIRQETCAQLKTTKLFADGKYAENNLLLQLQADISGIPVYRCKVPVVSTLGAAKAAGNAKGIELWPLNTREELVVDEFNPTTTLCQREYRYCKWNKAIERSLGWVPLKPECLSQTANTCPTEIPCKKKKRKRSCSRKKEICVKSETCLKKKACVKKKPCMKKKRRKKSNDSPKSGFKQFFRKMMKKHPKVSMAKVTEISKNCWRKMPEEERNSYSQRSKKCDRGDTKEGCKK